MLAAKDNPFETGRVKSLLPYDPHWIGDSWEAFEARLDRFGWRAAVIGPHGSGKTTFLEAFGERLRGDGAKVAPLFLNRQSPQLPLWERVAALPRDAIVLFDGAEQLRGREWRRFLRDTGHLRGLIATGHRPGRLPTLLETKVTAEVLRRCIRRLDPGFAVDRRETEALFHRHDGNLRHALLECYDLAASSSMLRE